MRKRIFSLIPGFAICVSLLTAQNASATCDELSFEAPSYFASGLTTNGISTGDLNGDGHPDIITANESSGSLTVRFGDGAGAFPTSLQLFAASPSAVAIADLNRDGILDLVTTHRTINAINVRFGLGGGAFAPPAQTSVGSSPAGVATGDLNNDGNLDIVASNAVGTNISLLLNNGSGAFPAATPVAIPGAGSWGIITGDLNGDGNVDVATANRLSQSMAVLLGNGTGGFMSSSSFPTGSSPLSIARADVNGDSRPDLITANLTSNNVTVRLNDGSGGFPTSINLPSGTETFATAAGDLDNDGDIDIVATNRRSNILSVYRGRGDGTFDPRTNLAVDSGPRVLVVADMNGDARLDIAAALDSGQLAVLLNDCSASNSAPTISAMAIVRQQDAGPSSSIIATVSDGEDDPADLEIVVNGGTSATVNGVTVSNIAISAVGAVTADVSASCGASNAPFTLTVTDSGDLSASATLNVEVVQETIAPVINGGKPIQDVTVHLPANSTDVSMPVSFELPSATDNCSAEPSVTSSPASGSIFEIGATTVSVTATDELNNSSTATFRVIVLFNFGGWQSPVDPLPMENVATGGSSVPVKFSLSGFKGMAIFAAGYPASSQVPCGQDVPGSVVEPATGGALNYDSVSDQYSYVWKTSKAWRGSCRIFILKLTDGSEQYAKFRFR